MIGRGGRGFYNLTDYLSIDYLWYNNDKKIIELWGSEMALKNGAVNKLKEAIEANVELFSS